MNGQYLGYQNGENPLLVSGSGVLLTYDHVSSIKIYPIADKENIIWEKDNLSESGYEFVDVPVDKTLTVEYCQSDSDKVHYGTMRALERESINKGKEIDAKYIVESQEESILAHFRFSTNSPLKNIKINGENKVYGELGIDYSDFYFEPTIVGTDSVFDYDWWISGSDIDYATYNFEFETIDGETIKSVATYGHKSLGNTIYAEIEGEKSEMKLDVNGIENYYAESPDKYACIKSEWGLDSHKEVNIYRNNRFYETIIPKILGYGATTSDYLYYETTTHITLAKKERKNHDKKKIKSYINYCSICIIFN